MSNFGEELSRQLESHNISATQLAERVEMSLSQIYSWLRGEQISVRAEQFNLIAAAITDDEASHARLLRAHLLDEKTGALGQQLVNVTIERDTTLKDRPRAVTKRERALEILFEESIKDRELAEMLISMAGYVNSDVSVAEKKIVSAIRREVGKQNTPSKPGK